MFPNSKVWLIPPVVVVMFATQGCLPTDRAVSALSINGNDVTNEDGTDGIVTRVAGTEECLKFIFSVDSDIAKHGTDVNFTLSVTNSCDYEIKTTEGYPPARMCIITGESAWSLCGQQISPEMKVYRTRLPRDGFAPEGEFTIGPGESASVTLPWDSNGYRDLNEPPAPPGPYDVYASGLGLRLFRDGYFNQHLTVEVAE